MSEGQMIYNMETREVRRNFKRLQGINGTYIEVYPQWIKNDPELKKYCEAKVKCAEGVWSEGIKVTRT